MQLTNFWKVNERLEYLTINKQKSFKISKNTINNLTRFIQTVIYTVKKILYIDTKVLIYTGLKIKSSLPLASDSDFT